MIRRIGIATLAATIMCAVSFSAKASEEVAPWSVAAHSGTLGMGLTVGYQFSNSFAVRGVVNPGLGIGLDRKEAGIDYDGTLKLQSFGALLDWHPFTSGFRLTSGIFLNKNKYPAKAQSELEIGDNQYAAEMNASLAVRSFGPYLGIGWSSGLGRSGLGFSIDIGAIYQGAPEVSGSGHVNDPGGRCDFSITKKGAAAVACTPGMELPNLRGDLEKEHAELRNELDKFRWYPVLSLGIVYRF